MISALLCWLMLLSSPTSVDDQPFVETLDPAEVTGDIYWEAWRLHRSFYEFDEDAALELDFSTPEPWPAEFDSNVRRYLEANAACLAALERATARSSSRFREAVPEEVHWYFRQFVVLVHFRARWAMHEGDAEQAFVWLARIYDLRDHGLGDELVYRLVALALEDWASKTVRAWLPRASTPTVQRLAARLHLLGRDDPTFRETLHVDRGQLVGELRAVYADGGGVIDPEQLAILKLAGVAGEDLTDRVVEGVDAGLAEAIDRIATAYETTPTVEALSTIEKYIKRAEVVEMQLLAAMVQAQRKGEEAGQTEDPAERKRLIQEANQLIADPVVRVLAHLWLSSMPQQVKKEARSVARRRATRIAVQLDLHRRTHGGYPATLDKVKLPIETDRIDPFSGEPFRYRLTAGGRYQLWSIGPNRIDDRTSGNATEEPSGRPLDDLFDGPEIPSD